MKGLKAANLKKAKFKFPGGSSPCNITGEKPILVPPLIAAYDVVTSIVYVLSHAV